jgi:hypothetical protein
MGFWFVLWYPWKSPSTKAGIAGMITGVVVWYALALFVHAAEAKAPGICRGIFGKTSLQGAPRAVIDPPVIALPLPLIVIIVMQ